MPPDPAALPEPPYYAVVFTSRPSADTDGYAQTSARMAELAAQQPGFLGIDSTRGADGLGITVSYWRDEQSIAAWRDHVEHAPVRARGRAAWYDSFSVHVARVERAYRFDRPGSA